MANDRTQEATAGVIAGDRNKTLTKKLQIVRVVIMTSISVRLDLAKKYPTLERLREPDFVLQDEA
jgi:hypothetical protein